MPSKRNADAIFNTRTVRSNATIITVIPTIGAAFGGKQPNKWFIYYVEGPPEDEKATYVWLGNIEKGYAIRQDGPARSPEK